MSILVVGTVALDSVTTPGGEAREVLGGSASYFACAAANFAPVRLVSVVGGDFPPAFRKKMAGRDIDFAGLQVVETGATFRWWGRYGKNLKEATTVSVDLNVTAGYHPRLPEHYRRTPYVFLANIAPSVQKETLAQMEAPMLTICDTMNHWLETRRDEFLEVLGQVDIMLINDEEARALTGENHLVRAGEAILARGPRAAVIKKGEHGAMLFTGPGRIFLVPAFPTTRVVDPTGAGDSFGGGFAGCLAAGGDHSEPALRRATAYGVVTASFTVEDFSTTGLEKAGRREIEERYRLLRGMTSF